MEWIWVAVAIGFFAVELTTKRLIAIWATLGALITTMLDIIFVDMGLVHQGLIFLGVSSLLILASYPLTKSILSKDKDEAKGEEPEEKSE